MNAESTEAIPHGGVPNPADVIVAEPARPSSVLDAAIDDFVPGDELAKIERAQQFVLVRIKQSHEPVRVFGGTAYVSANLVARLGPD